MKPIVISLGGSLIYPKSLGFINLPYLKLFKDTISSHIAQGRRFFIVTGGGDIARQYQQAGKELAQLSDTDLDWLGISATKLNATLVQQIFAPVSYPQIISDSTYTYDDSDRYPLAIASGWQPGNSTDYIAIKLAEKYQSTTIINLTNIDHVYTADPRIQPEATPIPEMSWTEYRSMITEQWDPGASAPFDPIASRKAEQLGLTVHILNGENLPNLTNCLNGQVCTGTVIR